MQFRRWALIFIAWTLVGLFGANQSYLVYRLAGREAEFGELLTVHLESVWLWVLFTPGIIGLARRFRLGRERWARYVPLHVAAALAVNALDVLVDRALLPQLLDYQVRPLASMFLAQLEVNVFSYGVIVAITTAADYHALYRERTIAAARLESQLATAQLQALRAQLQPHFLFNTLQAIAELVHEDADAADRMLTRLGELLRLSVEQSGTQEVPLREELEFLRAYLEIERMRFRDRLSVTLDVAPETLDARVPNLLLQPLVENAIRHGTQPRKEHGHVEVVARRRGDMVELEVRDDGRGLPAGGDGLREGVGLTNTRARLTQLYGAGHELALRNRVSGGTIVAVTLPYVR